MHNEATRSIGRLLWSTAGAAAILVTLAALPGVARAGVPFINLEGVGGVAFNPIAYPATDGKDGLKLGPVEIAKPRVGTWYVNLTAAKIDWTTVGIATAINNRVELSAGYESIAIQGAYNVHKTNFGGKVLALPENSFDTKFVPAISVGALWKSTSLPVSGDTKKSGVDVYLVATKLITQLPVPALVSAGVLSTQAQVDGIIGFNSKRKLVAFGNLDVIPVGWLALGAEVKQGPDYGAYRDAMYYNLHAGYLANSNLTLALAYTHAGAKKADPVGFGGGFVLGMQYAF
jgi:hypothetical protein